MGRALVKVLFVDGRLMRLPMSERLAHGELIWSVDSIESADKMISEHNERVKNRTESKRTILKEVINEHWDLSKIDETLKQELLRLYKEAKYKEIMKIHNKEKLSDDFYCCDSYIPKIKLNIERLNV